MTKKIIEDEIEKTLKIARGLMLICVPSEQVKDKPVVKKDKNG